MNPTRPSRAAVLAVLLVTTVVLGSVAAQQQAATVDPTPSGPSESESTHAVTFQVGDSAVAGVAFEDVLIDYSVDAPSADVSNVGVSSIERVGIDRGNDDPGSQVDVRADEIAEVSGKKDGNALQIVLGGNRTLQQGDQVVMVIRPVQNPQNAGTADVEVTVNTQAEAVTRVGSVTYEQHNATVTFADQTSAGETVVVDRVNLSEGGFVAVQNTSGATPGEIRGSSAYLGPGVHQDVEVTLDAPVESTQDLVAQSYTDSNADRRFDYAASGGEVDGPYRNTDDNIIGSDTATVTYDPDADATPTPTPTATPTPTPTPTATPTPTPTATPTDTGGGGSDGTPTATETATDTGGGGSDGTPTTTATPTDTGGGGGGDTATASPTPTDSATATDAATGGDEGGQSGTDGDGETTDGESSQQQDDGGTLTSEDRGAGTLAAVLLLLALLGGAAFLS